MWTSAVLRDVAKSIASMAILAAPATLTAQTPYGPAAEPAAREARPAGPPANSAGNGPVQALYLSAGQLFGAQQTPYVDANGNPVVVPVGYEHLVAGPCPDPQAMGMGGTYPPVGYDLMNDVGVNGYVVDQRGPHYFDVRVEYVNLTRDETFGRDIDFTSLNIDTDDIRLSSSQLELDNEPGFRILGRYDIGPLSVLEFGYMGIYDWKTGASFTDPMPVDSDTGNLYSLFSEFGTNPATVAIEGGPMPESERSITQSISLDVDLHSAEMSYRRYWVGYIPRISGTILAGFRYTRLRESFEFHAVGEAAMDYLERAENDLAGFQTGGDVWIGLFQGMRIGAEGKVGIYNNNFTLDNTIITTPEAGSPPDLVEHFSSNKPAFISEASVDVVADILPSWSLRAGYEILFLNSLVLAGENFNTASPYGLPTQEPRVPFLFQEGHAVFHGFHAGIEYIW
jgi:hypothetical protein